MATKPIIIKSKKSSANPDDAEDQKPKIIKAGAEPEDDDEDEDDDTESEKGSVKVAPEVSVKAASTADGDNVRVIMMRNVRSPRIGPHDLADIVGSRDMLKGKQYTVPKDAGEMLEDQQAATVVR